MQMSGSATDRPDTKPKHIENLYFWGEYEPDTIATGLTVPPPGTMRGVYPTYLNTQVVPIPSAPNGALNTDPFVFCGPFIYSNCRQASINQIVQSLQHGDVFLFGSSLNEVFVLDTCIVVDMVTDLASYPPNPTSLFEHITGDLIRPANYRIVEGTTWGADTSFSFVPAWDKLQNGNVGHPRPVVDLDTVIRSTGTQINSRITYGRSTRVQDLSSYFASNTISKNDLIAMWNEVVKQVLNQKCLLGTSIAPPACHIQLPGTTNNPAATGGCGPAPSSATKGGNSAPDVIGGSC